MPFVGLQCVIMVFPDHTHLLFDMYLNIFYAGVIEKFNISINTGIYVTIQKLCTLLKITSLVGDPVVYIVIPLIHVLFLFHDTIITM